MLALRIIIGIICGEVVAALFCGMATSPGSLKEWVQAWIILHIIFGVVFAFLAVVWGLGFAFTGDFSWMFHD